MIRVLIVDDHDFFRSCMVDLIGANEDLEVVGDCSDGAEVASAVATKHPDVVLMDVRMGGMSGIDAIAELHRTAAPVRVVMLTSDTSVGTQAAARAHGAVGYLVKGPNADLLPQIVRHVASGGTAWPEDLEAGLPAPV